MAGPKGKLLIESQGTIIGIASRIRRVYTLDGLIQGISISINALKATESTPKDSAKA
jgi:hypothetical protein